MVRLILEGGGMRGMYTAGVLDCFMDNDIWVDSIVGVSAGICHALNYVSEQKGRSLSVNTKYLEHGQYVGIRNLFKTGSIFNMELLFSKIPDELLPFDYNRYNERNAQVWSVVTNCETGEAEYLYIPKLTRGKCEKVQASASLPLLAKPVEIDGKLYLDGGVADSIPIKWSLENGADKNLVVLTQPRGYRKEASGSAEVVRKALKKYPMIGEKYSHRHEIYNESLDKCFEEEAAGRALILTPTDGEGVTRLTSDRVKLIRLYHRGYDDASAALDRIKEFLK